MEAGKVVGTLSELPGGVRLLAAAMTVEQPTWLVGGAVRDLLLGRTPREIDVAVEGPLDAILAALGGAQERFERFGTATVDLDGARIDFASTRTESYAHPGALPEVAPATLTEDLQRRDFTVNAIAINLRDNTLVAHEDALSDLEAGVLRVLHDGSFEDDPTRLWRGARYQARLGFTVDSRTAELAGLATAGHVSGERIGHEVRLALAEPAPTAVFQSVEGLNAGALLEGFDPDPSALVEAARLLGGEGRQDLLVLAACSMGVELGLLTRWLDHLQFTSAEREIVTISSRWVTAAPLRNASTPSEIARAARGAPLEAIALCGGANANAWINELRKVQLEITGDDLAAAGLPAGPQVGFALQAALDLTLDGEIAGRDEQLQAALESVSAGEI